MHTPVEASLTLQDCLQSVLFPSLVSLLYCAHRCANVACGWGSLQACAALESAWRVSDLVHCISRHQQNLMFISECVRKVPALYQTSDYQCENIPAFRLLLPLIPMKGGSCRRDSAEYIISSGSFFFAPLLSHNASVSKESSSPGSNLTLLSILLVSGPCTLPFHYQIVSINSRDGRTGPLCLSLCQYFFVSC